MDNNDGKNKINEETLKVITPDLEENKPSVVEVNNTNEVVQKTVEVNNKQVNETKIEKKSKTSKEKKGHPVFLVLLIIFLFAFVYFLPEITNFITDYKNKKTGVNELKSGNMVCRLSNSTERIDYNYELTFKYDKNRLKSSKMVTTSRLADNATDNSILTEKENSCQHLKSVLDGNNIGMSADCSVSAAVQITTQSIDYEKLNMNYITDNITEFEGFYPEYELDQSVTTIENDLKNNGYTCQRNER